MTAPYPWATPPPFQMTREQEMGFLKEEAKAIKGRLDEIEATLKELEEVRE